MSNKNTEISERIAKVIDFHKTNSNNFAKTLGYTRSQAIYDMLSGKAKPSFEFFNKFVLSEYSEQISTDWLITGEGEMIKQNTASEPVTIYKSDPKDEAMIKAQQNTIDTQKKLIASLERTITSLDSAVDNPAVGLDYAQSADIFSPKQTMAKAKQPIK